MGFGRMPRGGRRQGPAGPGAEESSSLLQDPRLATMLRHKIHRKSQEGEEEAPEAAGEEEAAAGEEAAAVEGEEEAVAVEGEEEAAVEGEEEAAAEEEGEEG